MQDLTPSERQIRAKIAAAERWGRTSDRAAATAQARKGLRAKFEREADPDGTLSPQEREYRADQLMRAHMLRMSLKAKQARRAKQRARQTPTPPVEVEDGGAA